MAFVLVSYTFLSVDKTHRHYMNTCIVISVVMISLGFLVPLATKPDQCYNTITPNDMYSSRTCGVSGTFILFGGLSAVTWICLRSIGLHLQICWQVVLGSSFMWGTLIVGWVIPASGLALALVFSGVSFRFGDTCHINHNNSLADFWIPLLVLAGITLIVQFVTISYCIKVYVLYLGARSTTRGVLGLPLYGNSIRGTLSPIEAYRRIRPVIYLQWRGFTVVLIIIAEVVFFSIIFVFLDNVETRLLHDPLQAEAWLICLIEYGRKEPCTPLGQELVVNEATVVAVLVLLSLNGIWCLLLLGHFSMFTGWYELAKGIREHASFEVFRDGAGTDNFENPGAYEMPANVRNGAKTPEPAFTQISSPTPVTSKTGRVTPDYFGRKARYNPPSHSTISPQTPSTIARNWNLNQASAIPKSKF